MQLAERLEDRELVGEVEVLVPAQQALEHELVRGGAAQADVRAAVVDDLVVRAVVLGGEPRVAERGERVGGDDDFVALADDNECGHGASECGLNGAVPARRGEKARDYTRPAQPHGSRAGHARAARQHRHRRQARARPRAARARQNVGDRARRGSGAGWSRKRHAASSAGSGSSGSARRARLLRQLLARRVDRDRHVQVLGRRHAEQPLQVDLPRRRRAAGRRRARSTSRPGPRRRPRRRAGTRTGRRRGARRSRRRRARGPAAARPCSRSTNDTTRVADAHAHARRARRARARARRRGTCPDRCARRRR